MAITQAQRAIAASSPLGEDVLLFRRMTATEQLSQMFESDLDQLSEDYEIELEKLLGQSITVRLERPGTTGKRVRRLPITPEALRSA